MSLFQAKVQVQLKPSVLDPPGEATRSAANRMGLDGVKKLRIGKHIELEIEASNENEAKEVLKTLSDRLLSNPVIEDWNLEFISIASPNNSSNV